MSRVKQPKQFEVNAQLALAVTITIPADSLEDALAKSKELKTSDFVDVHGSFDDGEFVIAGVRRNSWLPEIK